MTQPSECSPNPQAHLSAGLGAPGQEPKPDDQEPETDELLERLRASSSPEAYLAELPQANLQVVAYLEELLHTHQRKKSQVIKASGINQTYCYQIFQGTRSCKRDYALMIALGFPLTLKETQRLLTRSGHSVLSPKNPRDAVIIYGIERGSDRVAVDDELYRLGFPTLLAP